jgi:hypothetical protein
MRDWISVEDKLPEKSETWKEYLISVFVPYNDKHLVTTAMYDSRQKIWHWHPFSEEQTINAIIPPCDVDGGETTITHWMPLPESPYEF